MRASDHREKLKHLGFKHIYEWTDAPGTEYDAHAHNGRVMLIVTAGDITFTFSDEKVTLRAGDEYEVAVGRSHTAKVGEAGATYVVGEIEEEDS